MHLLQMSVHNCSPEALDVRRCAQNGWPMETSRHLHKQASCAVRKEQDTPLISASQHERTYSSSTSPTFLISRIVGEEGDAQTKNQNSRNAFSTDLDKILFLTESQYKVCASRYGGQAPGVSRYPGTGYPGTRVPGYPGSPG
eukprot:1083540-Rhodomonas_salina.1